MGGDFRMGEPIMKRLFFICLFLATVLFIITKGNAWVLSGIMGYGNYQPIGYYTTTFSLAEDPISEGGRWWSGEKDGGDWYDMLLVGGNAIGEGGFEDGSDPHAIIKGTWSNDQYAESTVYLNASISTANCYPEAEIRLRSALSAGNSTGYECFWLLASDEHYVAIAEHGGILGDYSVLGVLNGNQYTVIDGDTVKCTIVGNTITAYTNGEIMLEVQDDIHSTGNPGVGVDWGCDGYYADFGVKDWTASNYTECAYTDHFETIDTTYWTASGSTTFSATGDKWVFSETGTAAKDAKEFSKFYFNYDQDFEIRISYSNYAATNPSSGQHWPLFSILNSGDTRSSYIGRTTTSAGINEYYWEGSATSRGSTATTDTGGRFRIKKVSGVVTCSYWDWDTASWSDHVMSEDYDTPNENVYVIIYGQKAATGSSQTLTIHYDNFRVIDGCENITLP